MLFDSIVFAEKTPQHWVAGSNFFDRSELFEGTAETEATSRPVKFSEVFATLYHHLGISPHTTVNDLSGRPQYLVHDQAQPMRELI